MVKIKVPIYLCLRIWYGEISISYNRTLKQVIIHIGKRPILSVTNKIAKGSFIEFKYQLIKWTKQNNSLST